MSSQNCFQALSVPQKFDIDLSELDKNYFQLQMQFHPDKALSKEQKDSYLNITIKINDAYKILRDEFSRAVELLTISGININDPKLKQLDTKLLEEFFYDFESIQEANHGQDLSSMLADKYIEKKNILTILNTHFLNNDIDQSIKFTIMLKYIDNIIHQIKHKLQQLAIK